MPESITVNGTDLSSLVRNVEDLSGLLTSPARRGENIPVPGQHGQLPRADRPYDAGTVVLPMWVIGADAVTGDTLPGDAGVTAFYSNVDALLRLLAAPQLVIDHNLPDGSVRRAVAELEQEPFNFTRLLGSPLFGQVSVVLTIPGAFWRDVDTTTASFTLASGGSRTLSEFAAATAPMSDLDFTFGPGNNPQLTQTATGAFLAYDGVIGAGQSLIVHCDDTHPTPLQGTGGLVPDYTKLRYRPPRWFDLDPTVALAVQAVHTGGGSMSFSVAGRRAYLLG